MTDKDGRKIEYMRVSVTNICNLSCLYCDPFVAKKAQTLLTPTQIANICHTATDFGVRRVRLTGGEPLIRTDFAEIVDQIANIRKVEHIALTTNGILLDQKILNLPINSVNISINATSEKLYKKLCGRNSIQTVLDNARNAVKQMAVKINCVLLRDSYKEQSAQVIAFGEEIGASVRFIELMPMGNGAKLVGVLTQEIMAYLQGIYGEARLYNNKSNHLKQSHDFNQSNNHRQSHNFDQSHNLKQSESYVANENIQPIIDHSLGKGPAQYYSFTELRQPIGFISPMSACFCGECNRIRLLANGHLQPCLAKSETIDLLLALHNGGLSQCLAKAISQKQGRHDLQHVTLTALKEIGG